MFCSVVVGILLRVPLWLLLAFGFGLLFHLLYLLMSVAPIVDVLFSCCWDPVEGAVGWCWRRSWTAWCLFVVLNAMLPWYGSSVDDVRCLRRRNVESHVFWLVLVGQVLVWEVSVSLDLSLLLLVLLRLPLCLVVCFFVARCASLILIRFSWSKFGVGLSLGGRMFHRWLVRSALYCLCSLLMTSLVQVRFSFSLEVDL